MWEQTNGVLIGAGRCGAGGARGLAADSFSSGSGLARTKVVRSGHGCVTWATGLGR